MILSPSQKSLWIALASVTVCAAMAAVSSSRSKQRSRNHNNDDISFACIGNSIQYFNDCPRLLQQMIQTATGRHQCRQDSCLRGGASLVSIWTKGNGMAKKFATAQAVIDDTGSFRDCNNARKLVHDIGSPLPSTLLSASSSPPWQFVIFNDHTQSPAREETARTARDALRDVYAPALLQTTTGADADTNNTNSAASSSSSSSPPVAIFIQTAAYRKVGVNDTDDLGDFDTFSNALVSGLQSYADVLETQGVPSRVAPVGEAYRYVKRHGRSDLFSKLYSWDDFHPSPYGTFLQACVLYCTMMTARWERLRREGAKEKNGEDCAATCQSSLDEAAASERLPWPPLAPPMYNAMWWENCRYMQPPDEKPLPLPTEEEALELRRVAMLVCGVLEDDRMIV